MSLVQGDESKLTGRGSINISLERQEKLGVSGWVKVPVEKV
jgi:hypothetical protein